MKHFIPATLLLFGFVSLASGGLITFTGGDLGEGLDLEGTFVYAIRISDAEGTGPVTLRDATFTVDTSTPGVTLSSWPSFLDQWSSPNYGASANDNVLESLMDSIRHAGALPGTGLVDLTVVSGKTYKLQMMWHETTGNRGFDIFVEGLKVQDNFSTGPLGAFPSSGRAFDHQFVAGDTNVDIDLVGVLGEFTDTNPSIFAFTLELIPEPSSGTLAGLGVIVSLAIRRRSSRRSTLK